MTSESTSTLERHSGGPLRCSTRAHESVTRITGRRSVTSRLPGRKACRERGQGRKPAGIGAADIQPAELDALNQGVPAARPERQHTEARRDEEARLVIPYGLGAE